MHQQWLKCSALIATAKYIALAKGLSKPLISDDKRQCEVAVALGLEVIAINRFFASVDAGSVELI
jgi:predicted nucleic acid-binding protein